jgi:hypothetical protein
MAGELRNRAKGCSLAHSPCSRATNVPAPKPEVPERHGRVLCRRNTHLTKGVATFGANPHHHAASLEEAPNRREPPSGPETHIEGVRRCDLVSFGMSVGPAPAM